MPVIEFIAPLKTINKQWPVKRGRTLAKETIRIRYAESHHKAQNVKVNREMMTVRENGQREGNIFK